MKSLQVKNQFCDAAIAESMLGCSTRFGGSILGAQRR